jgi:hypothetical protein
MAYLDNGGIVGSLTYRVKSCWMDKP